MSDNPPAFACASDEGHQPGMTLRDWFAGQALPALWATLSASLAKDKNQSDDTAAEFIARAAYKFADAMLQQRERQQ